MIEWFGGVSQFLKLPKGNPNFRMQDSSHVYDIHHSFGFYQIGMYLGIGSQLLETLIDVVFPQNDTGICNANEQRDAS